MMVHEPTPLEEFAAMIHAIPAPFRSEIVTAALHFHPCDSFQQTEIVGFVRARLWDCLDLYEFPCDVSGWESHIAEMRPLWEPVLQELSTSESIDEVQQQCQRLLDILTPNA